MHVPAEPPFAAPARAWILFVLFALAGQFLLLANPGYFSHDELQWGAFAQAGSLAQLHWQGFGDWRAFQFRPLAFDLWLLLSRALFATPWAMHALFVAIGTAIGAGLLALLVRLGVAWRVAVVAALAFVLGPVAMYTHGWTATLADLLWVGLAMIGANVVVRADAMRPLVLAAIVAALTALALLAKEAAVVLPTLAALAWMLSGRKREWLIATVASGVPVAIYLALRAGVILFAPRAGGAYAWSLASIPEQWAAYQIYPYLPSVFEPIRTLQVSAKHQAIAGVLLGVAWFAILRAHWRAMAWGLFGGALALGPVLLLRSPSAQYAYAFSAVVAGAMAVAWPRLGLAGKSVLPLLLLLSTWHGQNVAWQMHRVGVLQSRFSPALAAAVAKAGGAVVRVRLPLKDDWVYERLAHDIPSYAGVLMADRVVVVAHDDTARVDYVIGEDGVLVPERSL